MSQRTLRRRLSGGVELQADGTVHARVWAPACSAMDLVIDAGPERASPLARSDDDPESPFEARIEGLTAGDRYWFRIDGDRLRPDPVSRWQPDGPHGPSAIVDPAAFQWSDAGWPGIDSDGQVIYELHVGTFTPEGTWAAAAEQLPALARLGITVVEMMPIADFPGTFGWGYDGVNLYAPTRLYGTPDGLRRFVDRAHAVGLGVILDVVYNHFGPDVGVGAQHSARSLNDAASTHELRAHGRTGVVCCLRSRQRHIHRSERSHHLCCRHERHLPALHDERGRQWRDAGHESTAEWQLHMVARLLARRNTNRLLSRHDR